MNLRDRFKEPQTPYRDMFTEDVRGKEKGRHLVLGNVYGVGEPGLNFRDCMGRK